MDTKSIQIIPSHHDNAHSVHYFFADNNNPIGQVHIYGPKNNEFFMVIVDEIKIQTVYNIPQITTEVCLIHRIIA